MLGPVVLDVEGLALTDADRNRLRHPQVGGVILFARNVDNPSQVAALCAEIRALRSPELLITVDQEGGRVQRLKYGFTDVPPMRRLGDRWDVDAAGALEDAHACGLVIGAELALHGIDFSFAPVLDVDHGGSSVIGDRAFHRDPAAIIVLADAVQRGFRDAGVNTVGKHYPGHGYVRADSHHEVPIDERPYAEIEAADLKPFAALAMNGMGAVMPAHVIYTQVDAHPAGFSSKWLKEILRSKLHFDGMIFSDDLMMEGASVAGGVTARAHAALDAGCDMVLLCNDPTRADELLAGLSSRAVADTLAVRSARMRVRREALVAPGFAQRLVAAQRRVLAIPR